MKHLESMLERWKVTFTANGGRTQSGRIERLLLPAVFDRRRWERWQVVQDPLATGLFTEVGAESELGE